MALFYSKINNVTEILSQNLADNIRNELKQKVMRTIHDEIDKIIRDTTQDLVHKIEAYEDMTGEISVNIQLKDLTK